MAGQSKRARVEEIAAYSLLWELPGVGPRRSSELVMNHGTALDALLEQSSLAHRTEITDRVHDLADRLARVDHWDFIGWHDPRYPKALTFLTHPPPYLFFSGDAALFDQPNVAIVGTREASAAGLARARKMANALAGQGITVTSGLAKGIDTAAHTTALAASGRTIAVLGTPLNQTYPRENAELQRTIARDGLVVSQYPFFASGHPTYFLERNRTMAALADATVVIEAGLKSGVQSQVAFCMAVGKPLFIAKSLTDRPHPWIMKALMQGAHVLTSADQVIDSVLGNRDVKAISA